MAPVPSEDATNGASSSSSSSPPSSGDGGGESGGKNIWVAAGEGDLDRVRHLVEVEGLSPTVPDRFTYTPLHAAASYGHIELLRFLINHPSCPPNAINETTDSDGETPLFVVEEVGVARVLIEEFGADAKRENNAGDTPAAVAEEGELEELAAYLRSVTGEAPMYDRSGAGQRAGIADAEGDDDDDEAQSELTRSTNEAIEERTEALMSRVGAILARAEARGASSGEELTEQEERELREVVGQSLFEQIREGWGPSDGQEQRQSHADSEAQKETEQESETPTTEEQQHGPRPGR
ncbi:ankyrin [Acaromyces ingoldii]|uniref:Ankyrin n=1 Tax=Acaromyces ingoldii TaxID=215250 RepID=A0A316YGL1_9BASI|nr:ankyrin [Acaromyces ingoldii]PWN88256.1 ankyrin [Acaromyces ingoldii]